MVLFRRAEGYGDGESRSVSFADLALTAFLDQYGFLLPGSLIRPSAEEITAGLVYLAQFIALLENPS